MEIKIKYLVPAFIFIFLYGCGGPYYFDLYLGPAQPVGKVKIDKILLVDDINSNEVYWTQRMVFRNSPYQVEYFTFKQWAKRPDELIKDAVVHFYRNSSLFNKVIEDYSSIEPDIILKINVYALEMSRNDKEWYAHLAMDLEVFYRETKEIIVTYSFDRKEKVKGKKARYIPEQISWILKEELIKVSEKLKSKLNIADN